MGVIKSYSKIFATISDGDTTHDIPNHGKTYSRRIKGIRKSHLRHKQVASKKAKPRTLTISSRRKIVPKK